MIACRGYGLGIGPGAAIMAEGQRPRAINTLIPRPYYYKQPLTFLLIGS